VPRHVFYSFHYEADNVRAAQVRNMGVVEGNVPAHDNDWESIKRGGDDAIRRWIDAQLNGRSCAVVLIGSQTAGRKWIDYEIGKAWNDGKGLVGIHIHRLKNFLALQSVKGTNPFTHFKMGNGSSLAQLVQVYDPPVTDSKDVYKYIHDNLPAWVDEACTIRRNS
jgi:hypothetical protein